MNSREIKFKIDIKSIAVLLLAVYFMLAPLEDILTSNIGTLGKYIIIPTMGILLIPTCITKRAMFTNYSWDISKFIICLIIISWLSVIWASDSSIAISRNSAYTTLPLVFIVLSLNEYTEEEYRIIKNAALIGGLITIIYIIITQGMTNVVTGRMTLKEQGNDPNNLAALFLLPTGLAFENAINEIQWKKVFYIFIFGLLSMVTLLTGSRGGLLSLIVIILAYVIIMGYIKSPIRWVVALLIIGIVTYFVLKSLPEAIYLRLFSKESYQSAITGSGQRLAIWKHVIYDVIPSMKPWGAGSGCAFSAMEQFYGYKKGIHNTYLCMLLEYGIFGIPMFLIFLCRMLKRLYSSKKTMETALLLGIMCTIFFLDSYAKKFFWNILYLSIISLQTTNAEENGEIKGRNTY